LTKEVDFFPDALGHYKCLHMQKDMPHRGDVGDAGGGGRVAAGKSGAYWNIGAGFAFYSRPILLHRRIGLSDDQ